MLGEENLGTQKMTIATLLWNITSDQENGPSCHHTSAFLCNDGDK